MHYSQTAPECQPYSEEYLPAPTTVNQPVVDKKVKPTRAKSAYRDAQFHPLFQALTALEELEASGETSVTYHTPSHPHTPTIHLTSTGKRRTPASKSPAPIFPAEVLTDAEELRTARFWRAYSVIVPYLRKHSKPAQWRDLSDVASLEWFHYALRAGGPSMSFTLNLSPEVEALVRSQPNAAGWLSKRIARYLKDALGGAVAFWFAFEVASNHRLHIHGELQINVNQARAARRALRLAAGEWDAIRQHQAHTKIEPSVVWSNYCAKDHWRVRPYTHPRLANIPRPIQGDWMFATNAVRKTASILYSIRRAEVLKLTNVLSKASYH
ncbi:hypothetical protein [Mesorhizobium sp. A623]